MQQKNDLMLRLENVTAGVGEREILRDFNWQLATGETCVLLGPNGAGKSSLGKLIAGLAVPERRAGRLWLGEQEITDWPAARRARAGIFLSWQQPVAIPGVTVGNLLRQLREERTGQSVSWWEFREQLGALLARVGLPRATMEREFNVGFSGGESKKLELVQLLLLEPRVAILDELDSGLDADAVRVVRENLQVVARQRQSALVIITHTGALVADWPVDRVQVLQAGQIVATGGQELLAAVQASGYEQWAAK